MKSYSFARVRRSGPELMIVDDCCVSSPEQLGMQHLALRVLPAVTWLAVYRWLQVIPVRIVLAQRRRHNNVVWRPGFSRISRDPTVGMS